MRDRLRHLFDLVDPMPPMPAPTLVNWDRLALVPDTGVRGASLRFELGDLVVHVEIGVVLTGLVVPAVNEVEVRWPDGMTWAPVDGHGLFEVDDVPRGPVRLVIGTAATDWFVR
ncbi:hypothetical protein [Actinocrispum wychmicini]|uniref:Uncharacterized protein n=1 Tax=Actinocrispum wychmicini TaxID=1213861 RepID=A0A4R2K5N6_9PSEU|nr:hypothetical protein [Actinocrispum wychmicini]TCO65169.1 hypothetical protein EV192_101957 [Actinocrispum wychmicini]